MFSVSELIKISQDPEKYGYQYCSHCNGYGSSLKDPPGVNRCTHCGGIGLEKKNARPTTLPNPTSCL